VVAGFCRICAQVLRDETPDLASAALAWHLYENHREGWIKLAGADRPPHDPDPRTARGRILIKGRRIQLEL